MICSSLAPLRADEVLAAEPNAANFGLAESKIIGVWLRNQRRLFVIAEPKIVGLVAEPKTAGSTAEPTTTSLVVEAAALTLEGSVYINRYVRLWRRSKPTKLSPQRQMQRALVLRNQRRWVFGCGVKNDWFF